MIEFNFEIELGLSADELADHQVDVLMDLFRDVGVALGRSARGRTLVIVTMPFESLTVALDVGASWALRRLSGRAYVVSLRVLPTADFDVEARSVVLPRLVSAPEAAELLGVSRQRVVQMIGEGKLPAEKVGTTWVIPRGALG